MTLNARPRFDLATDADEPEVRRILRENPMPGPIALSLEREPDSRAAARVEGPLLHQTIVGRRAGGGLFGFGTRAVRTMFLNGAPRPVGYLGALRLDADHRGDAAALRQGYRLFRALHEADGLTPIYLTSILADNVNARRLLEANLSGMPTYRPIGEAVTLLIRGRRDAPMRSRWRLRAAREARVVRAAPDAVAATVNARAAAATFASPWPDDAPGLDARRDARVAIGRDGSVVGVAALWDQRSFKQAVVRGYAPWLARCRPALNVAAAIAGRPRLPDVGAATSTASIAFLSAKAPAVATALVETLVRAAGRRGIEYVVVGLPAASPTLAAFRRAFGGREIRSRLYVTFWPDGAAAADALDGRPLGPEVALL